MEIEKALDEHLFVGPNLGYIQEQYERYKKDPSMVEPSLRQWFDHRENMKTSTNRTNASEQTLSKVQNTEKTSSVSVKTSRTPENNSQTTASETQIQKSTHSQSYIRKVAAAVQLANNIRTYGHLVANINPLKPPTESLVQLEPSTYNLSAEDLRSLPAHYICEMNEFSNAYEAIQHLKRTYTQTIAYQFAHVHDETERNWLTCAVESRQYYLHQRTDGEQKALLRRLIEIDEFEKFLHRTFIGQKRFSIEGVDMMIPMVDELISLGVQHHVENISMGMAHRGRLNMLAHVFGRPYESIFSSFLSATQYTSAMSDSSPELNVGWSGDVKYHMGADASHREDGRKACIILQPNPSHLEFVNPVVLGAVRAAQEYRNQPGYPLQDVDRSFAILIHGDAAFPGEGVVSETLNLSRLRGYHTGGTIHIIANNQLGFTTDREDARSTRYASDPARGFEIPIILVNADDPKACLTAIRIAFFYRKKFRKDFIIDLVGYRRYGHNEADDPYATQSHLYHLIDKHPEISHLYAQTLQKLGVIDSQEEQRLRDEVQKKLNEAYERVKNNDELHYQPPDSCFIQPDEPVGPIHTQVPLQRLKQLGKELIMYPESFRLYPKIERILKRRIEQLEQNGRCDWALAEALAFASLVCEGKAVRLTGQDTGRGTFAHRHLLWKDVQTGEAYCPIHGLSEAKASFAIHNSPLTETATVGFEYGYDVMSPQTLVIWEAQYGDFVNVAQVIIDQFISSGSAKWNQRSGIVLLLPHGYEGQGPEHSSARLERFLQLSAEHNWTVANLTQTSQYFHLLRKQAYLNEMEAARPLIIMTPKSLLRERETFSYVHELGVGTFKPILVIEEGDEEQMKKLQKIVLCSGKIGVDLQKKIWEWQKNRQGKEKAFIMIRIEQLYPFPSEAIQQQLSRFPHLQEIVWLQEEPENMGSWFFVHPLLNKLVPEGIKISYIGRPRRSSPATGFAEVHRLEQEQILNETLQKLIDVGGHHRA